MSRFKILLTDGIAVEGLGPLRDERTFTLVRAGPLEGDALDAALRDVDAVIVRSSTRLTREVLERAAKLSVIGRAGVGVDNIDVEAATERGIAVLNAPSGNTVSAVELTFALLLSLVRRIPAADRSMRAGEWDRKSFRGIELQGKVLGLVGAGRIGGEVARRARAFGMRVIASDPYLTEDRARALEVELVPLEGLLAEADVVSIHVPLTEATGGLIGRERIQRMKRGAYLLNAARGGVLDEQALEEALRTGHLAGAALDVFADEPLPVDHPLRALDNVVLTPHLGASTAEAQQNVALEIAEAVHAALVEDDYSRAINAPAVSGEEMRKLGPMLDLGRALGRLGCALAPGRMRSVEVRLAGSGGEALPPVTAGVLQGLLADVVGEGAVNFVNAHHLAENRGIEVKRVRAPKNGDYPDYLELIIAGDRWSVRVAGALLARDHPRLVRIGDFRVDVVPRGSLVVIRNRDVPGVIGRVGTILGEAKVNIAGYHQARLEAGGEALAAISVDGRLPPEIIARLGQIPEVRDVTQVDLR